MTTAAKIWIGMGGAVLLGCGLGGFVVLQYVDFPQASGELPKAMADAKAAGVPLVASELKQSQPVPPELNAADDFQMLMPAFEKGGAKVSLAKCYDALTNGTEPVSSVGQTIDQEKETLDKLRAISSKPYLHFDKDWDMGPNLMFPELAECKQGARVLLASAWIRAERGDYNGSAADIAAAHRLGALIEPQGTLISMLVRIAIDSMAYKVTETCLAKAANSRSGLAEYRRAALEKEATPDLRSAFLAEAYMQVATARNLDLYGGLKSVSDMSSGGPPPVIDPAKLRRSGSPPGMFERATMARLLQYWTRAIKTLNEHPDDPEAVCKTLDAAGMEAERSRKASWILVSILAPVYSQSGTAVIKLTADQRTKLALCQVLEWRAAHGRFPESLKAAGIDTKDPFGGEPLHYRLKDGGVRVWSVGPDRTDDQGVTQSEARKSQSKAFDIVAAYPPIVNKRPPIPTPIPSGKKWHSAKA